MLQFLLNTYLARSLEDFRRGPRQRPKIMNMRTHFTTDTTSFANGFLMLVMVVGMLNIELFESDGVSGYNDHRVLYPIELVLNADAPSQSPVLSISEDVRDNEDVEDRILSSHFHTRLFGTAIVLMQNPGEVNTRPIYFSHNHARSSNIPHQNSDEDEVFILPVDVA